MSINDILNSDLSDAKKLAMIQILQNEPSVEKFQEGGNVAPQEEPKTFNVSKTITINGQEYEVAIAQTEEEKEIGLSQEESLGKNQGMLFIYDEPQEDLWYTMEDTSIDLDIIFIDEDYSVTSVNHCKAYSTRPIKDKANNAQYVLETNINSGIKVGDTVEGIEDSDFSEEDREALANSKMLVLDEQGNVQMTLEGGERIFSRPSTKRLIKAAIKAYKNESEAEYRRVGRIIFKELEAQDSRDPEYLNE